MWSSSSVRVPSIYLSIFCSISTYCVLNTVNSSHVKIFLLIKLLECLPKCSSLPKDRHFWNINETMMQPPHLFPLQELWVQSLVGEIRIPQTTAWPKRLFEKGMGG
ncbi:hypothetical protein FD754_011342 [Muntiacus muntjak]|uniref:Uncharacterized protein n=1 Tax=Muntiacus muntjak TaxID=9888 RepID=A0A5N3VDI5_MUNMU|nr:hypothetical protein FD754_011342 [Muntiacus muntjak]